MTPSERAKYIWEYYKYFIIGFVLLVIFASYTIHSVVTKKDDILNFVIMTQMGNQEKMGEVTEKLTEDLLTKEERDQSYINMHTLNMDVGVEIQKMAAELSAGYIDIFIVDKDYFEQINAEQQLMSLQEISGMTDLPFPKEKTFYSPDDGSITGVDISAFSLFDEIVYDEDKILCIPGNAKNTAYISRFIEYLAQSKS